jgi:hypothetical protein
MNHNGDYLSDALAAQVGGIGIAPGGNINYVTGHAIFEAGVGLAPVADWSARASAAGYSTGSPKLAGQDCSKPTAPSGPRAAWSSPTAGQSSTPACASTAPPSAGCAPG